MKREHQSIAELLTGDRVFGQWSEEDKALIEKRLRRDRIDRPLLKAYQRDFSLRSGKDYLNRIWVVELEHGYKWYWVRTDGRVQKSHGFYQPGETFQLEETLSSR